MRHFFDPSLLPVTTTDIYGRILYVRTYGLHHYGYPDIITDDMIEEGGQLILDILDRIFSLELNIKSSWNYNEKMFKLVLGNNGLAHISYIPVDQVRIVTVLNPISGEPVKYMSLGLTELYNQPEAEVAGSTIHGKEMLSHLMDQVQAGTQYDEDTIIIYGDHVYSITYIFNPLGVPIMQIELQEFTTERVRTSKRDSEVYLTRIK